MRMDDKSQYHTSGNLLIVLEAILRASHEGPLTVSSVSVIEISMADVVSLSFSQNRVSDTFFISNFSSDFPLPQQQYWIQYHFTPNTVLLVNSTLHGIISVDDQLQAKNWDNLMEFYLYTRRDPYLLDSSATIQKHLLLCFPAWNI